MPLPKAITVWGVNGGLYTQAVSPLLPPNASDNLGDVVHTITGRLAPRPGLSQAITYPSLGPVAVNHIGKEITFAGVTTIMAGTLNTSSLAVKIYANANNAWTDITGALTQTGSEDVYPTSCGFKGHWFFAPGGATSNLLEWDGDLTHAAAVVTNGTASLRPPTNPKIVLTESSGAHLFLMNYTDASSAPAPQGVAWSGFLAQNTWNGDPLLGLGSGSQLLADDNEPITAGTNYGPFVIAFKSRSMYIAIFDDTASTGTFFDFVCRETDRGCDAQGSIQPYNNQLLWLGNDNVFLFDGNTVQPLADRILSRFLSQMDPAFVQRSMGVIDRYNKRYTLFVPLAGPRAPSQQRKMFMFDFQGGAWTEGEISSAVLPMSSYVFNQTWAEQALIGARDGEFFIYDPAAPNDGAGRTIPSFWESKVQDIVEISQGAAEVMQVESVQVHGSSGIVDVFLSVTDVYELVGLTDSFEHLGQIAADGRSELSVPARGVGRFAKVRFQWPSVPNAMQVQGFTLRLKPVSGRSDR